MKKAIRIGGKLLLFAYLLLSGLEGSSQQLIKDIKTGADSSSPDHLTVFNGKLYFTAEDTTHGREIWVTDGTKAGTKFFYEARSGVESSFPTELTPFKNHLYFSVQETNSSFSRRLYRSDATTTERINDFWSSVTVNGTSEIETSGDYIYFNGSNLNVGREIWVSDGTNSGTEEKDVYPFKSFGGTALSSSPGDFTDVGGILFFNGSWESKGRDPYYLEGTTLKGAVDINPNLGNSEAGDFTRMGDYVYFSATRDKKASINGPANDEGNELWRVKIGSASPQLVKNIYIGAFRDANPRDLYNWGDSVIFFRATDNGGTSLWKTDGSEAGTVKVNSGASAPQWFVSFKNKVYFVSQNHLWRTDGTFNGTEVVDNTVNITSPFTKINNRLYFTSSDTLYGEELWETDGTKQGTQLVKDIYEGTSSSSPKNFAVFNNTLYFTANDSAKGEELFAYTDTCNAFAGNVNLTGSIGLCAGDSVLLKATSLNNTAVFSWWYNGNVVASNIDSLSANQAGNYRLITDNGNGCIDTSEQITVTWFTQPSSKILTPKGNTMCDGDMDLIELVPESSTSSYEYQWIEKGVEMNNVTDTAIKTNRTSNFQVRITNGKCTITTDTVFTTLYQLPTPNTPNTDLCAGSEVTLNPGVFDKYLWTADNDTNATKTITAAGNYEVTVTDDNGCSNSGTFIVAARPKPTVSIAKFGNAFEATADAGVTYRWLRNGVLVNGATQSIFSPTLAGNYSAIATNQFGCSDTSQTLSFVLSALSPQSSEVRVYPNPIQDILIIELNTTTIANAAIYDMQGKKLKAFTVEGNGTIKVNDLPTGLYFLKVNGLKDVKTYKLIKQ